MSPKEGDTPSLAGKGRATRLPRITDRLSLPGAQDSVLGALVPDKWVPLRSLHARITLSELATKMPIHGHVLFIWVKNS